jgi:hypothetical protein
MAYFSYFLKFLMVAAAMAALYVGLAQGGWGETMFNATLL